MPCHCNLACSALASFRMGSLSLRGLSAALGHQSTHEESNRFQFMQIVKGEVRPRRGWAWGLAGDLNHAHYFPTTRARFKY